MQGIRQRSALAGAAIFQKRVNVRALYLLATVTLVLAAACGGPETPVDQEAAQQPIATVIAQAPVASSTPQQIPPTTPPQPPSTTPTPQPPPTSAPQIELSATPEPLPTETPLPEPTVTPEPLPTETPLPEPSATPEPPVEVAVELAPALGSIDGWYNSAPLALTDLLGRPVLLVFWADY